MGNARLRFAIALGDVAAAASRALRRGSGSVISGRVIELVEPDALASLLRGRTIALVSGTNGKSTTTALLAAAVATEGEVATNRKGSNMPAGIVAALAHAPRSQTAVLEVDEGYLPAIVAAAPVQVVVLLNLSRDQLDRVSEVRKTAERWRAALDGAPFTVIANADDPSVSYAARAAPRVVWVAAGDNWTVDATSCPNCGGRISFAAGDWRCGRCELRRPPVTWSLDTVPIDLAVPGEHNRRNALMALAAADALGVPVERARDRMRAITDVEGRYRRVWGERSDARLLLSKNPAGWIEMLDVLARSSHDVAIVINAEIADGLDTSWLWDVPFERLRGKHVVASGKRVQDLAVRLQYAELDVEVCTDLSQALDVARRRDCDVVANYTAFQDVRRRLGSES